MPGGGTCNDKEAAKKAWEELYGPFCKKTGAIVLGFGPSVVFGYNGQYANLPVDLLRKINESWST